MRVRLQAFLTQSLADLKQNLAERQAEKAAAQAAKAAGQAAIGEVSEQRDAVDAQRETLFSKQNVNEKFDSQVCSPAIAGSRSHGKSALALASQPGWATLNRVTGRALANLQTQ